MMPVCLALLVIGVSSADAAVLSYWAPQSVYTTTPGAAVDVDVYLAEELGTNEASPILDESGLASFDVQADWRAPLPTSPATIAAAGDIQENTAFSGPVVNKDEGDVNGGPDPAFLSANVDVVSGTSGVMPTSTPVNPGPGTNTYWLGTFTYTVGGVVGETTLLRFEDYSGPNNDVTSTFTWNDITASNPLDEDIQPFEFEINVIPEPTTTLILGLGAIGLVRRRYRR